MSYEIKGTAKHIGEVEHYGNNGFSKRELVLITDEQYPQPILIEFVKDKSELLDNVAEGESVIVSINIRGREWTSPDGTVKYFNSFHGWKLEKEPLSATAQYQHQKETEAAKVPEDSEFDDISEEEQDDIPF